MKELTVTGHVGNNPTVKTSKTGERFITFPFAIHENKKKDKVEWMEISCSEKSENLFELIEKHVQKGARLLCIGYPTVNAYIDKNNQAVGLFRLYPNTIEFQSNKKDEKLVTDEVIIGTPPVIESPIEHDSV